MSPGAVPSFSSQSSSHLYRKVATLPGQHCRRSLQRRDPSMVMIVGARAGFSRLLQTGGVRTRWVSTRVEGRRQLSQPTIGGHRRVPVLQKSKRATCDQTEQRENQPKKGSRGETKESCRVELVMGVPAPLVRVVQTASEE